MRLKALHTRLGLLPIVLLVALCVSCGVAKNSRYHGTIGAYKTAVPIQPEGSGQLRRWANELTLPSGTRVTLKACYCGPSPESRITLKYSDEERERVLIGYKADYSYPVDIRIETNLMYAKVTGGLGAQPKLIVYDLTQRKKLSEVRVDPRDLE